MGYVDSHLVPVDGTQPGILVLDADFGEEAPVANLDEVRAHLDAIQAAVDHEDLRYFDPGPDMDRLEMEAFARQIQAQLGLIYEHAEQAKAHLPN